MLAWLIDLRPGATAVTRADEQPLGPRAHVVARLVDLLPGTTFDADGRGTFRRGGYAITFSIADAEPTYVEVDVDKPEGLTALTRIVEKTGWRVVDPAGPALIDLAASRAAGAFVHAGQQPKAAARSGSFRPFVWIAASVVLLVGGVWLAWSMNGSAAEATTQEDGFEWSDRRLAARHDIVKTLPPELRDSGALSRLIDVAIAERDYHATMPHHRYSTPLHLVDWPYWKRLGRLAMLPPSYSNDLIDGYRFDFKGANCEGPDDYDHATECDSFVYFATPTRSRQLGQGRPPGFALYSSDMRIRYKEHGALPEEGDEAIDTARGGGAAPTSTSPGFFTSLRLPGWLGGSSAVEESESAALSDLRALADAERFFRKMVQGEPKFLPPEQLADAGMWARFLNVEPALPARFTQPERNGYSFEFIGDHLVTYSANSDAFHPVYERFVYVARPTMRGARVFALYQDGSIFAAKGGRVPTPDDDAIQAPTTTGAE
jgi:hypothetical protein